MRNNTNYMETGVLSALQLTSQFPKIILENFYKKSRNSIEDGKAKRENIHVSFHDVPATNYAEAGVLVVDQKRTP